MENDRLGDLMDEVETELSKLDSCDSASVASIVNLTRKLSALLIEQTRLRKAAELRDINHLVLVQKLEISLRNANDTIAKLNDDNSPMVGCGHPKMFWYRGGDESYCVLCEKMVDEHNAGWTAALDRVQDFVEGMI